MAAVKLAPTLCRLVALLPVLHLVAGCRQSPPASVDLVPPQAKTARALPVTVEQERRPAILTPVARWSWRGRIPEQGVLHVGAQAVAKEGAAGAFELEIRRVAGAGSELLTAGRSDGSRWLDLTCDLRHLAGRKVTLEFVPRVEHDESSPSIAWSTVRLSGKAAAAARPNVLVIVIDTLRADHLTPYGYARDTSPEIARHLAARGMTFEKAYSQAPWTLPSAASYMTSRYPGELVSGAQGSFGLPADVPTLAERLRASGYATAGYIANPTLHPGNGFDRGFDTFYGPPGTLESMTLHADELNRRVRPWLRARGNEPFFLYLHYIDPHDPYETPVTSGGRSPYFPEYRGPISGEFVHGIYAGSIPLADPENDVRQVVALYDSEIHYVDARVGELLDGMDPAVLADTLVVLTADHGEELHDHGGWKHGQTLYEEQIRVPLFARWDGRIAAGSRLAGAVRLLDLVPTLLAAAGETVNAADQGVNLLGVWRGEGAVPRLPVIAEHLSTGPRRAAAIVEGRKLVLFDARAPFTPADGLQAYLWRQDLARLRRAELYDLAADPGEHRDLVGQDPEMVARLQPLIHHRLEAELAGARLMVSGLPAGSRLDGTILLERAPQRWAPYFLGESDAVELHGQELRFRFFGDSILKGALIEGDFGALVSAETRLDGAGDRSVTLLVGAGGRYGGGKVELSNLLADPPPQAPEGPALRFWISRRGTVERHAEEDPETVKRLQALGYIQR
jgi:arylsulfatase A-like enzyme